MKEVVELAGYTQIVANMFEVFEDCSNSKWEHFKFQPAIHISNLFPRYQRSLVPGSDLDRVDGVQAVVGQVLPSLSGEFLLEDVPIVTPNGDVIVPSLSLKVKSF